MSLVDHYWPSVRANPIKTLAGRVLKASDLGSLEDAERMMALRRSDIAAGRKPRTRLGKPGSMTYQSASYVLRFHGKSAAIVHTPAAPPAAGESMFTKLGRAMGGDDSSVVDGWF